MGRLLHDGLLETARRWPDRDALVAADASWSFADLSRAAGALAGHLTSIGVGPGDRVALISSNRPELVVAVQAVSRAGAAVVLISPAWKSAEVEHALALTEPVAGIADGDGVDLLAGLKLGVISLDELPAGYDGSASPDVPDAAESVLVFSSGTTGLPKAVRHTHRSMCVAVDHWIGALGLGPDDRFQVATPPTHILGLLNLLAAAATGARVRLHRRFDLEEVLRSIESDRLTLEMAVAPIALAIANHPELERCDLSSLRYIMWGATPVTASVAERVTAATGVRWLPAYGASEVPVIACNPVAEPDRWRLDSAGIAPSGVELRVVDLETGAELAPGGVGEIQVRGESVMAGYLPLEATEDAFDRGWYRTGDVGSVDAGGWVRLTDRSKEMIKVNGFQVAPAEVEAVLYGHRAVLDCAVFGVPDERAGEVPLAAVQLDPAIPIDTADLRQLVADTLATYKQVRDVLVVDTIPRLPSGKVLRRVLRDQWLATG